MKRLSVLLFLLSFSFSLFLNAQETNVILKIGDHEYSADEFWHVYNKNKHLPGFKESPEEFSQRFIDYKLKVVEAINQGLDTVSTFLNEFNSFTEGFKSAYLIDSTALENEAAQAFARMQDIVKASHILVTVDINASPSDTLKAWEKIEDLRQRYINGEDFNELAVNFSEDPSAKNNAGELGYFSAFRMVYPFEKAAFSSSVGEVSEIIRSDYGYHILLVHERFPNQGRIRVAHIMKMFPNDSSEEVIAAAYLSIDSVYQRLLSGEDFSQLASIYSDDRNSSVNGGEMAAFSVVEMVPEFAFAAFDLENDGDISEPVQTDFGWHIIKRLEHIPVGDFESNRAYIRNMLRRTGREVVGKEAFVDQKKKGSAFYLNQDLLDELMSLSDNTGDNDDFFNKAEASDRLLFKYYDKELKEKEFIDYLTSFDSFNNQIGSISLSRALDSYISDAILEIERRDLAKNNPEFRFLINEYYDGLLIFDLSSKEIWQNIGSDTILLMNYYEQNKLEFATPAMLDGIICEINTARLTKRAAKEISRKGNDNLVQILKDKSKSEKCYNCLEGSYEFIVDAPNPVDGNTLPLNNPFHGSSKVIYWKGDISEPVIRPYEEVVGHVMSSYQNNLEKEWVKNLREIYKPEFNYDVMKASTPKQ